MSMLITVARARLIQGLSGGSTTLLTALLTAASDAVEKYCDRLFETAARTEVHDGTGADFLYVRALPITALTTITIYETGGTTTEIASGNFVYDADSGRITFGYNNTSAFGTFPAGTQNISVAYTGGYESDSIPDAVQQAVALVALEIYGQGNVKTPGLASERLGDFAQSYFASANRTVWNSAVITALLEPYRRIVF